MSNFDSPLEEKFFTAARERIPGLVSQMEVIACGRGYRLDFVKVVKTRGVEALKVAIELDGYEYHSSKEQRNHDVQRDRDLMAEGWQIIRFTGSHVNRDVDKCVEEAAGLIEKWAKDKGVDPGLLPRKSGPLMPPKIEKRRLGIGVGIGKGLAALVLLVALCALLMASGLVLHDQPAKTDDEAPSLESLTPDAPGPGRPGSEVIWTAQASDPNGDPIMYRFLLKGPATGGSWSDARGWTKENTWRW
jgi:very-short-patch-repair endonuclease